MIIVKLKGGLGNQMFQYAMARALAVKNSMPLKLDISFLLQEANGYTKRDFELDKFTIQAAIATPEEVKKLRKKNLKNFFRHSVIRERSYKYIKPFINTRNDYYINGYWQKEKYFKEAAEIIRKDFEFKEPLSEEYFDLIQKQITDSNSVSVHFRRGDYVSDKNTFQRHGVCSLDYYQKAVHLLSKQVADLRLFIFSDDITWVKNNFATTLPMIFIEKKDEQLHSDFRLMSMCKHNIIANSSYSWWAAWLNPNKEKIVIAPEKWYNSKRKQRQAKDMVPKDWWRV